MEPTRMPIYPIYPIFRPDDDWNVIDIDENRTIMFKDIYHDPEHPSRIRTDILADSCPIERGACLEINVPMDFRTFFDFFRNNLDDPAMDERYSGLFRYRWWRIRVIPPTAKPNGVFEKSMGGIMLWFEDRNGGRRMRSINDFGVWTEICLALVKSARGFLKRKDLRHMYKYSCKKSGHAYMEIPNPMAIGDEYYMCLFRKKLLIKDDPDRTPKTKVPRMQLYQLNGEDL